MHHDDVRAAIEEHERYITAETLAVDLVLTDRRPVDGHRVALSDGRVVYVAVSVAG
jgi:hypothetical protein